MASTVLPNGIIIPEKFSRDWYSDLYHNWEELDNLLGGGTPKDGTLTIQKNGTDIGTFSANQATDETINITVPDVNNGTLTIQQNGTTVDTFTANSSSDKTVNIQCVDLTNNQTVGGDKTLTGNVFFKPYGVKIKHSSQEIGVVPSSNQRNGINFTDKNNSSTFSIEQAFISNGNTMVHFSMMPNTAGGSLLRIFESTYDASTGRIETKSRTLIPDVDNSRNLGTSTNKWKSFNGINPGALSLPGNYINVDTTNWILDGSDVNGFIPASDGWLGIQAIDTVYDQMHYVFVGRTGGGSTYYQQNLMSSVSALWDSKYHGCVFIPVIKNINYGIRCICSSIVAAFYPCRGNV